MVFLQRRNVARHRLFDVDSPGVKRIPQHFVVLHLGGGHARHRDPAAQVRRHLRFVGEPIERGHLAIGEQRKELVDARMIGADA